MTSSLTIEPRIRDLGGFSVRRVLPYAKRRMVGPWVFFDHLGPASFPAGEGMDVRPHPHIGLATVTYLFDGELFHRDSLGNEVAITPGAINWMTAGRGIVHSERTREALRESEHSIHALQLWLALPKEGEECDPAFFHYPEDTLPRVQQEGANIRVMIGSAYGASSPVKTYSRTLYCEIFLEAGASITLPDEKEQAVYIVDGEAEIESQSLSQHTMLVIDDAGGATLKATTSTHLVIIGGEPLGERHLFWNFVSSSKERLEQAKQDWEHDKFDKVPGETEFIPLPKG